MTIFLNVIFYLEKGNDACGLPHHENHRRRRIGRCPSPTQRTMASTIRGHTSRDANPATNQRAKTMPQASEELRDRIRERFGDIDTHGPEKFLTDAGYVLLNKSWTWKPKPGVEGLKDMTRDEFDCLLFLVHEWDYGSLDD